jgi:GT2 family glycosyltransferase
LLEEHLKSHNGSPGLVAGPRSCYPETGSTDRFGRYDYRADGSDPRLDKTPFSFTEAFTCNISIQKKLWMTCGGFDERLPSFEDIEFAYRAVQAGVNIRLETKALAYHNHPLSFTERCHRLVSYTKAVPLLYQIHPELRGQITHLRDKEPIDWKKDKTDLILIKVFSHLVAIKPVLGFMEWMLSWIVKHQADRRLIHFLYWQIMRAYLTIGFREGISLYGSYK